MVFWNAFAIDEKLTESGKGLLGGLTLIIANLFKADHWIDSNIINLHLGSEKFSSF